MYCQNTHDIIFRITDSVVIKKSYPYATKINLEISVSDWQDMFFLYYFHKCVASYEWSVQSKEVFISQVVTTIVPQFLQYIIVDDNHQIVDIYPGFFDLLYIKRSKGHRKCYGIGTFVNSKQKIIRRKLKPKERLEYDFAKFEVNSSKQNVSRYLLLSIFHYDLPKGEYWLYLTYSFNPGWQYFYQEIANDSRTFKGSVVSNKVKLIVE